MMFLLGLFWVIMGAKSSSATEVWAGVSIWGFRFVQIWFAAMMLEEDSWT